MFATEEGGIPGRNNSAASRMYGVTYAHAGGPLALTSIEPQHHLIKTESRITIAISGFRESKHLLCH